MEKQELLYEGKAKKVFATDDSKKVIQEFKDAFKDVDVMMAPATPIPAFKVGEKANDPLAMYQLDVLTIPASAAGLPAISIPCGFTQDELPVGLQIIGPQWAESLILQVAAAYEQNVGFGDKRPALV